MKTENLIAYKGDITLDKAVWDNVSGMTVLFQLEQRPHELTAANPFKKFTKMRSGRVGTRFSAFITMSDGSTLYSDELMLKGWNDGTSGWKVTFWIAGDECHPFMTFDKGTEMAMAVVELDDDQTPIDQVKRDRVTKPRKAPGLSNYAALLCRTPEFQEWIHEKMGADLIESNGNDEEIAKVWMCEKIGISSRAELDSDSGAATRFHKLIREPYAAWNSQRQ